MEWFALIIPIALAIVGYLFFKHSLVWWELLLPIAFSVIIILVCKVCVKTSLISDDEYWGSTIIEARYYEYWSTWITETCSYQTCDGTDKDGNCTGYTTHYYDCSHCNSYNPYWEAYDDVGNNFRISEGYYKKLIKQWKTTPGFVELDRNIDTHFSCGVDGNMYSIRWDKNYLTADCAVTTHSYTNRVQASHSAFKLQYINKHDAAKLGLYSYPKRYDVYKQKVFLGADSIYTSQEVKFIEQIYQYFNGYYGSKNKIKLFVCLFYDKPISIADKQQAYWDGGNQNELVICLSVNRSTKQIQWVKPFSWTDNKRLLVDLREDIMNTGKLYPYTIYKIIEKDLGKNILYKDFKKDFSYLTVDLPSWSLWMIWILTIACSVVTLLRCISNDCINNNEQDKEIFHL